MLPLIKADILKLATVRSTYVLLAVCGVIVSLISFYVFGYYGAEGSESLLADAAATAGNTAATFLAIIAILQVCHEYRFNTILFTLTATNSRTKALVSKLLVFTALTILATLVFMALGVLAATIGAAVKGIELVPQTFAYMDILWRTLFFGMGWVIVGLLFGYLFRNVAGAIVVLFMAPIVEGMLQMVLKENTKYLPFTALEQVGTAAKGGLTTGSAALLFGIYLVAACAITWWIFRERDVN